MDINKARQMMFMMQNGTAPQSQSAPIPIQKPIKEGIDVDLNYIIQNKPDIKIVREYFKRNIQDLDVSE
jgi:hypothetical protein